MSDRGKGRSVGIHQPNFFPWLGYFDKLNRSDAFVLLDTVQFPKKGGTWINRVKVLINREARWLTAPVNRSYHGYQDIRSTFFDETRSWRSALSASLTAAYRRAACFDETMELITPLLLNLEPCVAKYNEHAIRVLATRLGIDEGKMVRASELRASGASNDLLVALTLELGGTDYLCGGGAGGYQDDSMFAAAGLAVRYQSYVHPVYGQTGAEQFIPGLSCIDALMHTGVEGTRRLLGIVT